VLAITRRQLATERHQISPYDDPDYNSPEYQSLSAIEHDKEQLVIETAANSSIELWQEMPDSEKQDYILLAYGYRMVPRGNYDTVEGKELLSNFGQQALCRLIRWELRSQAATEATEVS
jgi:hypothetical protein